MKTAALLCLCLLAAASLAAPARAATAEATLEGANEVPPIQVTPPTTGTWRATLEPEGWKWTLRLENADQVTMAHIHEAPAGKNGPVVVQLLPLDPKMQTLALPISRKGEVTFEGLIIPANFTSLLTGKAINDLTELFRTGTAYVNVHSVPHPDGVARGQVKYTA